MVFLPNTNTVILLEPYCGTITEPGLPVFILQENTLVINYLFSYFVVFFLFTLVMETTLMHSVISFVRTQL